MQALQQKDPKIVAKIIDMVESGVSPEDIGQRLEEEREREALEAVEGPPEEEQFAAEIKIIAQALAYREAVSDDLHEIMSLLSAAYACEIKGPESYRVGEPVSVEQFISHFEDKSYTWLVCEAPNGRGVEKDGVILGVSIYSTDGVSTRNGSKEGSLGSIRFFAVLPRFHGVCIGLRLLKKTELSMYQRGCVRCMACCPSPRKSIAVWLKHRGYTYLGSSLYPFQQLGQLIAPKMQRKGKEKDSAVVEEPVYLMQFLKMLENTGAGPSGITPVVADSKGGASTSQKEVTIPTVLRLAYDEDHRKGNRDPSDLRIEDKNNTAAELAFEEEDEESIKQKCARLGVPYEVGKMHLPPHWRQSNSGASNETSQEEQETVPVDANDIPLD